MGHIYLLTVLLRRGAPISLSSVRRGREIVKDYTSSHCRPRYHSTKYGKIEIKDVVRFPSRMIMFITSILAGSATLHLANKFHMQYNIECMESTIFNWSEGVLENMKEKLTKANKVDLKFF